MRPFVLFGADHLGALLVTALLAAGLTALVRRGPRPPAARAARVGLALALFAATVGTLVRWSLDAPPTVWDLLPLQLCDLLILVAIASRAGVQRNQAAGQAPDRCLTPAQPL